MTGKDVTKKDVAMEENVLVGKGGSRELLGDVFRPSELAGPVPGVLFLPGGSWFSANRQGLKTRYGVPLAKRGIVCVTGEYRVTAEAPWPAQIQDVKTYIRWMRANCGSLNINPSAIAVAGKSAGGHLALLAGGSRGVPEFEGDGGSKRVSSEVNAAIGVAPISDLSQVIGRTDLAPLLGENPSQLDITLASPIGHVNPHFPYG